MLLHLVLIENKIGRLLTEDEEVHHIDLNPKNNDLSNLQLLTKKAHRALHDQLRPKRAMVTLTCPSCLKEFTVPRNQTHLAKGYKNPTACSRSCRGKFSRKQQLERSRSIIG